MIEFSSEDDAETDAEIEKMKHAHGFAFCPYQADAKDGSGGDDVEVDLRIWDPVFGPDRLPAWIISRILAENPEVRKLVDLHFAKLLDARRAN